MMADIVWVRRALGGEGPAACANTCLLVSWYSQLPWWRCSSGPGTCSAAVPRPYLRRRRASTRPGGQFLLLPPRRRRGWSAEQRAALSPSLAASLPQGTLFPAGSTVTLDGDSWHQAGDYANATGDLSEPGVSAQSVEIGFISTGGQWLVTFEEPLS